MVRKAKDPEKFVAEPEKILPGGTLKLGIRVGKPVYAGTKAEIKTKAKELIGRRGVERVIIYEWGPRGGFTKVETLLAPKKPKAPKAPKRATTRIPLHKTPEKPERRGGRLVTRTGKLIRQPRGVCIRW